MPVQPVFHYAGFWKRFVAYLLDQIIIGVIGFFIVVPFLAMIGFSIFSSDFEMTDELVYTLITAYLSVIILGVAAEWLYFALMESMKGATLGKMALGIIVTDMQGNRISFGRATGRYFAKIISSLTMLIGYIMAGFTQKKQALHDMIAGCLVINKS
jgi:uncharacterized RDD family membrane protein YckC